MRSPHLHPTAKSIQPTARLDLKHELNPYLFDNTCNDTDKSCQSHLLPQSSRCHKGKNRDDQLSDPLLQSMSEAHIIEAFTSLSGEGLVEVSVISLFLNSE